MDKIYTDEEILGHLALACYRAGGVRKWAKKHNCTHSTVSRILKGTQPISKGIANILKIEPSSLWVLRGYDEDTSTE